MFFQMPEEIRKQMEEMHQRQEMAADSYRHDVTRLFAELNRDQLATMRNLLHQLVFDEDCRLAAYYEGQVSSALNYRFNVCPSCGVNHEEEAAQFDKEAADGYFEKVEHADSSTIDPPQDKLEQMLPTWDLSEEDYVNMEKYHLDDLRDADSHQILGFKCTGVNGVECGMVYPSIEDRMLRPADSCSGCQQKAAWG